MRPRYPLRVTSSDNDPAAPRVRLPRTAGDLMKAVRPLAPETTNETVHAVFAADADVGLVAIVDADRPIGTIERHAFMEAFARPFARDLYAKKSCTALMRADPLAVDGALPVGELARLAVARRALDDGFVITWGGRYAGVAQGAALVAALSALEAERGRQLRESVDYASTIQRALLASSTVHRARALPDSAVVWEPRDVVGGDCYCLREVPSGVAGAVLDCTGHGVPGAFMTCIAYSALEQALASPRVAANPGHVLAHLDRTIKAALRHGDADAGDDGLDGVVFHLSRDRRELRVAGAKLPVFVRRSGAVEILSGARVSVGHRDTPDRQEWPEVVTTLEEGSLVAISTDGFIDQIGGPRRIAFGKRRLAAALQAAGSTTAAQAVEALRRAHQDWQGGERRRDDATLLAFTIGAPVEGAVSP